MIRKNINNTIYDKNFKSITIDNFIKKKLFIIDVKQFTDNKTNNYTLNAICLNNDGNKYLYNICNIKPFFDIEFNSIVESTIKKYEKLLLERLFLNDKNKLILESIFLKPYNYYSYKKIPHIRLKFKNIIDYKIILNTLNKDNILNNYIRQNENNYSYYNKVIQYEKMINVEKIPNKTLLMTWDIETYSYDKSRIPDGLVENDDCFLICGTFHNYNDKKILASYAFTTIDIEQNLKGNRNIWLKTLDTLLYNKLFNKNIEITTINKKNIKKINDKILDLLGIINYENLKTFKCNNEKNLILKFINMIKNIKPDIITGFNDHSYDWVYIKNKIENYYIDLKRTFYDCFNVSDYYISNYEIKPFNITSNKISADMGNVEVCYPNSNYIIFIDTRTEFRKMFPKDIKSNLNYYLSKFKLDLKEDLPYKKLFQIYENKDINGMSAATLYCLTDAFRCQELLIKKQNINEHYTIDQFLEAEIRGITLKNSINRANGFKVFNYILKEGIKYNYSFIYNKFEKKENEIDDFCGGYVADPIYGLNLDCPVIGLDFASLYPNIQRTLNLGPDVLIRDEDVEKYKNLNLPLRNINNKYLIDHQENEDFKSIIVKILTNLFDQRVIIKKLMLKYKSDKEIYNNIHLFKFNLVLCFYKKFNLNNKKINDLIFNHLGLDLLIELINDLDQKQKTIKVLMNSFYGLLGSPTSQLYCKFIAQTITKTGREMLCQVRDYVKEKNYIAHYSDTDSVYVSCPKNDFLNIELDFKNNKINSKELFINKINITKSKIKILLNDVNIFLKNLYKYDYIKMAYEEVLFPVFFIAKKMYFGIEHMDTINFDDIDNYLFMRGYSPVRRNTTLLTKEIIVNQVIRKLFSLNTFHDFHINNHIDIFLIIKHYIFDIINKFNNNSFPLDFFIKSDRYSPNKNNIRINTFINKLKIRFESFDNDDLKRKYIIPEPYERFNYVYVDKQDKILYNGKVEKFDGLGNIMEYPCYLNDFNSKLNFRKYFESDLANELGCLIHPKDGKKYVMKIFELFTDYIDNQFEINNIFNSDLNTINETKNKIKNQKSKDLRILVKNKTIDFNNIKKDLFINYPLLFKYDLISNPYTFIENINNNIDKLNFNDINIKKSNLYKNYYNNEYYKPNLQPLYITLNKHLNILYDELSNLINVYCDTIYNNLNQLIEDYCINKDTIIDFDYINSLNIIIQFINLNHNLINNIEITTNNYYDIVFKLKKYDSFNLYIDKLKKSK